jgi:hypothetical protein
MITDDSIYHRTGSYQKYCSAGFQKREHFGLGEETSMGQEDVNR